MIVKKGTGWSNVHIETLHLSGGWRYDVFSADSDPDELGVFADIKRIWDFRRKPDRLPAWSDFEFRDWEGWYGWLAIEDIVSRSPYDSVFRLWGTKWTAIYGQDFTGQRYRETDGAFVENEVIDFWERMSRTHNIVISAGVMDWLDANHRLFGQEYLDIVLPMSDDGRTVDKFLMVLQPGDNAIWKT